VIARRDWRSSSPVDVNRRTPAFAAAEGVIRAPLELVWSIQSDIESWSRWNPAVSEARMLGPLTPGTQFRWRVGRVPIVSTLREVHPPHRLVWSGRSLGIRAIHVWCFAEEADGVRARTEESFEGPLVRPFARWLRRMLAASLEQGLAALRAECERRVGSAAEKTV
jgi:hypothetical protein